MSRDRHPTRAHPPLAHGVDADGVPWPTEPPPELGEDPPEDPWTTRLDDPAADQRDPGPTTPANQATAAEDAGLAAVFPLHPPHPASANGDRAAPAVPKGLVVQDLGEVLAEVDAAGPARWLLEGLWPADAYGVLAAEDKAGKTWAILDLAVSVAAGVPWLGHFACPTPGRVLVFLGEGGNRAMVRRLRAICAHKQVQPAALAAARALRVCFRVPKLTAGSELETISQELTAHPAALVVLDPLYLAVGSGGLGGDLYAMGAVLAGIQGVCQSAGAALVVVTHWNKTGEGRGAKRITGVGPGAWGRVLISAGVVHRTTDPATQASTVVLEVDAIGGEIPDQQFRIRRRVHAQHPGDLDSPLHYQVEVLPADQPTPGDPAGELTGARRWVLDALRTGGAMQTVRQLGDRTAGEGHPLKERTIQAALDKLEEAGLDDCFRTGSRVTRRDKGDEGAESRRCFSNVDLQGGLVHADLDTLVIALYVSIDELFGPRTGPGRRPKLSDAELVCLAVAQVLLGFASERRWLRFARTRLGHLFPYLPTASAYNRRLRRAAGLVAVAIADLAAHTPSWGDQLRLVDSTPVPCAASRETVKRSELAGHAGYGYCKSHHRYFWGFRLYVLAAPDGLPVAWCLATPKLGEREVVAALLDQERARLRPGLLLVGDKGFAGREFEQLVGEYGARLLRPDRKGEPRRQGSLGRVRQWIESLFDTLKGQLSLEQHGGRTLAGVYVRVAQRLLALAAGIWWNWELGQPDKRSLVAYDSQ